MKWSPLSSAFVATAATSLPAVGSVMLAVGSIHAGGVLCSNLRGFLDGRTVVGCGSIGRLYVIQFSLVAFRCLVRGVTSGSDEALGAAG